MSNSLTLEWTVEYRAELGLLRAAAGAVLPVRPDDDDDGDR